MLVLLIIVFAYCYHTVSNFFSFLNVCVASEMVVFVLYAYLLLDTLCTVIFNHQKEINKSLCIIWLTLLLF